MTKVCDNKSVGVIIINEDKEILLIERKKFPLGFAAPSGHIDDFDGPEACAKGEVREEVGLTILRLNLVLEETKHNPCRREGGGHHRWWIYDAEVDGVVEGSEDETKQVVWCNSEKINELMYRTKAYQLGEISEKEWENNPGLELVWYEFFKQLKITNLLGQ